MQLGLGVMSSAFGAVFGRVLGVRGILFIVSVRMCGCL